MERSTVVALLVVVGLGGLVLWWYMRTEVPVTGQEVPSNCGSGVMGSIGQFIKGHVDRKNSLAPLVGQAYTKVPASSLSGITNVAGKLSPSNWLESKVGDKVGNFFCNFSLPSLGSIANAVQNKVIAPAQTFGTANLAAGTVGPVKSLASAGSNLVHGNFGDAGTDVYHSVVDGPKTAVTSTYNALKSISPF